MLWPEQRNSAGPVTFRVAAERQFRERLAGAGAPAGTAELPIMREWRHAHPIPGTQRDLYERSPSSAWTAATTERR